MGTRATITILNEEGLLVKIYKQFNGYPSGLGKELKSILNNGNVRIINGIGAGQESPAFFNGMGCLAAYLIEKLKNSTIGGTYITNSDDNQEYNYTLFNMGNNIYMRLTDYYNNVMYDDLLRNFNSTNII